MSILTVRFASLGRIALSGLHVLAASLPLACAGEDPATTDPAASSAGATGAAIPGSVPTAPSSTSSAGTTPSGSAVGAGAASSSGAGAVPSAQPDASSTASTGTEGATTAPPSIPVAGDASTGAPDMGSPGAGEPGGDLTVPDVDPAPPDNAGGGAQEPGADPGASDPGTTDPGQAVPDDGTNEEPPAPDEQESTPTAPMTGPELYLAYCAACHGEEASGGELGPQIRFSDAGYSEFLVRNGRSTMTYPADMIPIPVETLSAPELALISEYLWSFPKPTEGADLFVQMCGNCHGADGRGGPTGRSVVGEAMAVQRLVRNGHDGGYDDRREFMPAFDQMQITDAELQLLQTFISSL